MSSVMAGPASVEAHHHEFDRLLDLRGCEGAAAGWKIVTLSNNKENEYVFRIGRAPCTIHHWNSVLVTERGHCFVRLLEPCGCLRHPFGKAWYKRTCYVFWLQ